MMKLNEMSPAEGSKTARTRVGRGIGSGLGKTAGRGHKGQHARKGGYHKVGFEGGQMPFFRRMPKFGFTNANFKTHFWTVNLGAITAHADFKNGGEVNHTTLIKAGLVRDTSRNLKILGDLEEGQDKLNVKLVVDTNRVTDSARKLIVDAGGSVNESGTRRDRVRGIDRNADDRTPKNLTKKLKNQEWHRKRSEAFAKGEVLKKK